MLHSASYWQGLLKEKGTYNDRYKTESFQKCGYTPEFH